MRPISRDGVSLMDIEQFLSPGYPHSIEYHTTFSIDRRQLSINAALGKTESELFIQRLLKEQFKKALRHKRMKQTRRQLLRKPVSTRRSPS
jgi:hypothetical protein